MRLSIIEFCPEMATFLSKNKFKEHVEPLLKLWLEDSVHQVRLEAVNALIKLKTNSFNLEWLENIVDQKLEELHKHTRFGFRMHTLHMISLLHTQVSDQFLNEKMYKAYMKGF